jgi:error-prone DNA polymerase
VGVAPNARGAREGTQLALPLEPPEPPALQPLGGWEAMIADYRSTGMTLNEHPMELMRDGLDPGLLRSTDLERVEDGSEVEVAGMVVARQRPETANGIVFILLEDERGTVNLIVPPPVYERHRAVVRAAPLARARGRLERREGIVNVLVAAIHELERTPPDRVASSASYREDNSPLDGQRRRAVAELRAVAPAGHSWGRRGR